jgi:hypothetical protein
MQLVERQILKPNDRFYPEADRLFLLSKKLDNCQNYIYCENFLSRQPTNALAADRALKKSVNDKALPAKLTHNTLRLLQTAWTSYHSVTLAGCVDRAQRSFKQHRKSLTIKSQEKNREKGRYLVVLNCQSLSNKACPKEYAIWSGTNFSCLQKSHQSWKSGLFPR